jgi:hypothetical protein
MGLKNFNDFVNESASGSDIVGDWKKNFLETIVKYLEESPSVQYDSVVLDPTHDTITVDSTNVIDGDKDYSIMDVSRPTINMDYRVLLRFIFNDSKIKAYLSTGAKYGLVDAKFEDLFKLEVANTLEVTIEEIEDFYHAEGSDQLEEIDIDKDFQSVEEFAEDFHMQVDHWMEELCPPIPGQNVLRDWLDQYEEENKYDNDDN